MVGFSEWVEPSSDDMAGNKYSDPNHRDCFHRSLQITELYQKLEGKEHVDTVHTGQPNLGTGQGDEG